jgi:hypothetical protein
MEYKGYNIVGDGTFGMKLITNIGRGALPSELRGSFSSQYQAQRAIDGVIEKKEVANGKAKGSD